MLKLFVALFSVLSMMAIMPLTANAASPVVHPGMSIYTNNGVGIGGSGTWCTVAAVGHDDAGRLLGFTAGHCIPPNENPDVKIAGTQTVIGHWVTKPTGFPEIYTTPPPDISHDYAFFEILPQFAISNQLPNGTRINAIGNTPVVNNHHCKYGQVSRTTCGWVRNVTNNVATTTAGIIPGDSGGPAYTATAPGQPTGTLIGINSAGLPGPNQFSGISGIMADVISQGPNTPGIGFEPLP